MGTRSVSTKNGTRAIRAKAVSAIRQPLADALFTSTQRRLATGNAFLKRVLEGPIYLLSGELEAIKLAGLRSEVDAGLDALRQTDFIELDQDEMLKAVEEDRAWLEAEPVGNELL